MDDWDTDLLDTVVAAARWSKIAGLVAWSGQQVLFDDYWMRQGRNDLDFMLASFKHDIKFLGDEYDFRADQARRKKLRAIFRQVLAYRCASEEPFCKIVWPLKQRVDEYDFLAKHGCEPPDGGNDA